MADEQFEKDVEWVKDKCEEIQAKMQGSASVFTPTKEDEKYYTELVRRKIMVKDPMGEGYIFSDKYKIVYAHRDCNGVQRILGSEDIVTVHQTEEEKENDHRSIVDQETDSRHQER